MSTQNQRRVLPSAAVDRLFARFAAIYGAQKMAGAWGNVDVAERNATWAEGLGRFDLDVIGDAVRELGEDGTGWPPSLPEFAAVCQRHHDRPGRNVKALPVPRRTDADLAHGREQMARIRAMLRTAVKPMPARVPGSDDE
jgi:hypothetical protein